MLAGPGSGKTFTIIQRILYLLGQGVAPQSILVITFTREAAVSMQKRFRQTALGCEPVSFGTFHSVFYSILREAGVLSSHKIADLSQKTELLTRIIKKHHTAAGLSVRADEYSEEAKRLLAAFSYYKNTLCQMEARKLAPAACQADFDSLYRQYRDCMRAERKIDFDDMLLLCKEFLENNETARECLRRRFRHILIDEFQDINPVQYEVLKLLSAAPHHIFAVGDDDQSIYGFRGSEPGCMLRFEKDYHAERLSLAINYRSCEKIVSFSGKMMEAAGDRFAKKLRSGAQRQDGYVKLLAFEGRPAQQQYLAERLAANRQTAQSAAVLFRTNAAMQRLAALLQHKKIPYCMKERAKSIYEHFIVKDLMAYLLLAEGKGGREDMLRIINKPFRAIGREEAAGLFRGAPEVPQGMRQLPGMQQLPGIQQLEKQLRHIAGLPPGPAVTYVLKAVGYEAMLRQLSEREPEKWQEWQEIIGWLKQDAAAYRSAAEWQEAQRLYGEQSSRREKPADPHAVQLMTVHAAKGLEFDTVFIPDCNECVYPHGSFPDDKTLKEERRILYVAVTRAKRNLELLYLTGTENSPRPVSRFLNGLLQSSSSSSSTNSSNSQLSRYSSNASATFSYSESSSI